MLADPSVAAALDAGRVVPSASNVHGGHVKLENQAALR